MLLIEEVAYNTRCRVWLQTFSGGSNSRRSESNFWSEPNFRPKDRDDQAKKISDSSTHRILCELFHKISISVSNSAQLHHNYSNNLSGNCTGKRKQVQGRLQGFCSWPSIITFAWQWEPLVYLSGSGISPEVPFPKLCSRKSPQEKSIPLEISPRTFFPVCT